MRKKKLKFEVGPPKPIVDKIPYSQFFDRMVSLGKLRSDQQVEVGLFFKSRGLEVKESIEVFEKELKNY